MPRTAKIFMNNGGQAERLPNRQIGASPAYALCAHVWKNVAGANSLSWQRLNHSMHRALSLAITSGMRFERDDFNRLMKDFRGGYWVGAGHELLYSEAVKARNRSACRSYEHWQERKPIFLENARMFVGRQFIWQNTRVRCTSIGTDHLIAVVPKGWEEGKERFNARPDKLFRITREQVKQAESKNSTAGVDADASEQDL